MGRNTIAVVRCLSPHHVGQDTMSICCLITGGANLDALVEAMSVGFPHCEVTTRQRGGDNGADGRRIYIHYWENLSLLVWSLVSRLFLPHMDFLLWIII